MNSKNKTTANNGSVTDFLMQSVSDEQKRNDCLKLIDIMTHITGKEPQMWGPSIIGFDSYHYTYDSGREGDMCILGFSPRKANLTIYFVDGFEPYQAELKALGKHTSSKACLYIKNLADIDLKVLESMLTQSYKHVLEIYPR